MPLSPEDWDNIWLPVLGLLVVLWLWVIAPWLVFHSLSSHP
jgi:uncharacterized membrane protein YjgN (DUF898 family)